MQNLDPSYLRYIYDSLDKGSIHPENASELPDGLIGLYEETFDDHLPVLKRQYIFRIFILFALLKKEVTLSFVAEVLEESESNIADFISTFSSWFNSPESGKYQLYHERLKVYILQKLSEKELDKTHEKLISRLEKAIEEKKADEFEKYALEFLGGHYYVRAMFDKDKQKLIDFSYNQSIWNRQLQLSKGYNWTKASLKAVMDWSAKYSDEEVIECSFHRIDLYMQEQNAISGILELVAMGDCDTALFRIETFGDHSKDGLQRKFILYMLCLMELTLLESRDKDFARTSIDKLLKHLDQNIPVDHTVLNWNDFFPSYLMFEMVCKWEEMGLDYLVLYKRSKNLAFDYLNDENNFSNGQIKILLSCVELIESKHEKVSKYLDLSKYLFQKNQIDFSYTILEKAIETVFSIEKNVTDIDKINLQRSCTYQLAQHGKIEKAFELKKKYFEERHEIIVERYHYLEHDEVKTIFNLLKTKIDLKECLKLIKQGFFTDDERFYLYLEVVSIYDDCNIEIFNKIFGLEKKSELHYVLYILSGLFKSISEADFNIDSILKSEEPIQFSNFFRREECYSRVVEILAENSRYLDAYLVYKKFSLEEDEMLKKIILHLIKNKKTEDLSFVPLENIKNERLKRELQIEYFLKYQNVDSAIFIINSVESSWEKSSLFIESLKVLANNGLLEMYIHKFFMAIKIEEDICYKLEELTVFCFENGFNFRLISDKIKDSYRKNSALSKIAILLSKTGDVDESIKIAELIEDDKLKIDTKEIVAIELVKQGILIDNLKKFRLSDKILSLTSYQTFLDLERQFVFSEIHEYLNLFLSKLFLISKNNFRNKLIGKLCLIYSKENNNIINSLKLVEEINDEKARNEIKIKLLKELYLNGRFEESNELVMSFDDMQEMCNGYIELLSIAVVLRDFERIKSIAEIARQNIKNLDDYIPDRALLLIKIFTELSKVFNWKDHIVLYEEAKEIADEVPLRWQEIEYRVIAYELANARLTELALEIINDNYIQSGDIQSIIATEYHRKGNLVGAKELISKALSQVEDQDYVEWKEITYCEIFEEMYKQGDKELVIKKMEEVLSENSINKLIKNILINNIKSNEYDNADLLYGRMSLDEYKKSFWSEISKHFLAEYELTDLIFNKNHFIVKNYSDYIYSLSCELYESPKLISDDLFTILLKQTHSKPDILYNILQNNYFVDIFFKKIPAEKLNRYSKTLNLQWAIDLKEELDQTPN